MKDIYRYGSKLFFLVLISCLFSIKGFADETSELMKQVGFSYKINHPSNQIGGPGALNLMMKSGQEQTVNVTIKNTSNQDITILVSLNGARTNGNGGLEYGPNRFKADASMAYDLPDLVEIPSELKIPKNNSQDLELKIKMPKVGYKGIVTGGIQMIEKESGDVATSETMIVNKVAYLFGITLQTEETKLKPALELQKVYPEQANFRNAIYLDVANTQAMKVKGLMLDVEITKAGQTEVLYESKKNSMEMAPNTLMSYPISFGGEKMVSGKYTAHVLASAHEKEWQWEQDFTITKEQADLFNQKDVNLVQERGLDWQLIVIIVVSVVFVITGIYVIRRLSKKKKKSRKRKKK